MEQRPVRLGVKIFAIAAVLVCLSFVLADYFHRSSGLPELNLMPGDRILILSPHPDDETLGCAGIIQGAVAKGLPVHVVFLTYGDNYSWASEAYPNSPTLQAKGLENVASIRHDEAIKAAEILGLSAGDMTFLGYPDFGTLPIWMSHWAEERPLEITDAQTKTISFENAFRPGVPCKGESILKDLEGIMRDFKPTKIFCASPRGGHSDHAAFYLFATVALWDLAKEIKADVYSYLIHFQNWPNPAGYCPDESFLLPGYLKRSRQWKTFDLTDEQRQKKEQAIRAYASQCDTDSDFLLSFVKRNEVFCVWPKLSLPLDEPPVAFSHFGRKAELLDKASLLPYEEQEKFTGIERRHAQIKGDTLVFFMKLLRPLDSDDEFELFLFGYRPDVPFGDMPKVAVHIKKSGWNVLDQSKVLTAEGIRVIYLPKEIVVEMPLSRLHDPAVILTSIFLSRSDVAVDWTPWRILEVRNLS